MITKASRLLALLVIGTFLTSLVAAGHGVLPVGVLLVFFWGYWSIINVLAWLGMLFLILGCVLPGRAAWRMMLFGAILLTGAWLSFLSLSEPMFSSIVFSLHFLVSVIFLFKNLFLHRFERCK